MKILNVSVLLWTSTIENKLEKKRKLFLRYISNLIILESWKQCQLKVAFCRKVSCLLFGVGKFKLWFGTLICPYQLNIDTLPGPFHSTGISYYDCTWLSRFYISLGRVSHDENSWYFTANHRLELVIEKYRLELVMNRRLQYASPSTLLRLFWMLLPRKFLTYPYRVLFLQFFFLCSENWPSLRM